MAVRLYSGEEFAFRAKYSRAVDLANRTIVAAKCERAPKLDGTLNDPLWSSAGKTASVFTNFPSSEACGRQSVVFCCYDESALYIAFDCEEPELDQQQIDNKAILAADHVGVYLEVGDTRGRGARCNVIANRSGYVCGGAWREHAPKLLFECKAGPNRWFVQLGIPFKYLVEPPAKGVTNLAPLRGETWGVKFTRYGKNTETGAARMRSCWPHIPTISEDVVTYNANLCFGAANMLADPSLAKVEQLTLHAGAHYALDWNGAARGDVRVSSGNATLGTRQLDKFNRLDFVVPKENPVVAISAKIDGAAPVFQLKPVLDDVPADWICLTNNDWVPERNLKSRIAAAPEGSYIYLKTPMRDFGVAPYRSLRAPEPDVKQLNEPWSYYGRPTRKPLDAPPARPEIGEEEYENFPFEVIYQDHAVPEFVGLPSGSFDVGGMSGWIPFSKGSLTGDESWAGWPVDRWSGAAPHDIVFDFKDKYFIRRVDIQQINTGVRNLEILVRGDADPAESFVPVYRFNGPGTERGLNTIIPVYFSQSGIDSVAQQLRLSLGINGMWGNGAAVSSPNLGRPNCQVGLFGIAEVWVWAEPKGAHADGEVNTFKAHVPNTQPPIKFEQLRKLAEPVLWPRPKEMVRGEGRFAISAATAIVSSADGQLPALAGLLRSELAGRFCTDVAIKTDAGAATIDGMIQIGVKGANAAFDAMCERERCAPPAEPQGYSISVTPARVLVVGADIEGAAHGVRTLMQWIDHDERAAFLRLVAIRDWPVLPLRTLVPSSDHRRLLLPLENNPVNYYTIVNAASYLRFNALLDWLPSSTYQNEAKTRELVHYASDRFTDLRPALWVQKIPGDCIEANPDDQPEGGAGIQNSDGTWESDNLCPSNAKSYAAIEKFIDEALKTRDTSRYIDVGFTGAIARNWNVCRLCRKRGLSGFELYGDFMNKIDAICRARGRVPIFTNAIMYSDAVRRASANVDGAAAFDAVNRGVGLRLDRPASAQEILQSGFWTISKPWDTPRAISDAPNAYGGGGKTYFDSVPMSGGFEGVIVLGERCDYEWEWRGGMCSRGLMTADAFWNGGAPEKDKTARGEFEQQAANACVRFNERVSTGIEYPSWRTGMAPAFFNIDIKALCNRSHIDEGTASGPNRSGPLEGATGYGAAFDFRRIPTGRQEFAAIPFDVIEPSRSNWKSMLVVGTAKKEALIPGSVSRAAVPVGRKAASLCILRTTLRTVFRAGQTSHYWNVLQPAYVFEYSDGSRCVCDWEMRRHWDDLSHQCFFYGSNLGPTVLSYMMASCRLGYAANTLSGAGATLFVSEIVNPYPEKEIRNLLIQLPNPEERDYTFEFHDAIFAVTGVEPTEWDRKVWSRRPAKALLPANSQLPAGAKKIEGVAFKSDDKMPIRKYQWAAKVDGQGLPKVSAVTFRLRMPWRDSKPMSVRNRHADVTVFVSRDMKEWKRVAEMKGCSGMDGEHVMTFAAEEVAGVRVALDCSAYADEDNADVGLLACDLFEVK